MHPVLSAAILLTFATIAGAQQQKPAPRKAIYRMQFLHSDCF